MRSHLLNETTADLYRRSVTEGVDRVAAKLASTQRPHTGISVDELAPVINGIDLDKPLADAAAVLDELEDVYLRDAVYFHHPRYLGHLNCPVVIPAVLGEAILSAVNSSSTPGTSPSAARSSSAASSTGPPSASASAPPRTASSPPAAASRTSTRCSSPATRPAASS